MWSFIRCAMCPETASVSTAIAATLTSVCAVRRSTACCSWSYRDVPGQVSPMKFFPYGHVCGFPCIIARLECLSINGLESEWASCFHSGRDAFKRNSGHTEVRAAPSVTTRSKAPTVSNYVRCVLRPCYVEVSSVKRYRDLSFKHGDGNAYYGRGCTCC